MFRNLSTDALRITGRPSEVNELALTYGYTGIDLPLNELQGPGAKQNLEHAHRLLASTELTIGCCPLSISLESDDDEFAKETARFERIGPQLQAIGCSRMSLVVRPASDSREQDENLELHQQRIAQLAEVGGRFEIQIGLDFLAPADFRKDKAHEFLHDFSSVRKLADAAGVGYVVDPWSIHAGGESLDVLNDLDVARIVRVFLSDAREGVAPGDLTDKDRLLPGEGGVLDVASLLTKLHELEYAGPVSIKAPKSSFVSAQRDSIVREAGERLRRLWAAFDPKLASQYATDEEGEGEAAAENAEGDEKAGEPAAAPAVGANGSA